MNCYLLFSVSVNQYWVSSFTLRKIKFIVEIMSVDELTYWCWLADKPETSGPFPPLNVKSTSDKTAYMRRPSFQRPFLSRISEWIHFYGTPCIIAERSNQHASHRDSSLSMPNAVPMTIGQYIPCQAPRAGQRRGAPLTSAGSCSSSDPLSDRGSTPTGDTGQLSPDRRSNSQLNTVGS